MAGKELQTQQERGLSIEDYLLAPTFRAQLELAAPRGVQAIRMARAVLTLARGDSKLAECSSGSLRSAVMCCVQTGLEPGPLGHAAIVPFARKATWQAMYKGLLHLAYRSDKIAAVQAGVVYANDEFDHDMGSAPFVHFKKALVPEAERGERVAAFAAIVPKEGPAIVRVEHISEIERIRDRYSKGQREDRPWLSEFDEMACKTVIKRAAKWAPVSVELGIAIGWDDLADTGKEQKAYTEDPSTDDFCNKAIGDDGMVCSLPADHPAECAP